MKWYAIRTAKPGGIGRGSRFRSSAAAITAALLGAAIATPASAAAATDSVPTLHVSVAQCSTGHNGVIDAYLAGTNRGHLQFDAGRHLAYDGQTRKDTHAVPGRHTVTYYPAASSPYQPFSTAIRVPRCSKAPVTNYHPTLRYRYNHRQQTIGFWLGNKGNVAAHFHLINKVSGHVVQDRHFTVQPSTHRYVTTPNNQDNHVVVSSEGSWMFKHPCKNAHQG